MNESIRNCNQCIYFKQAEKEYWEAVYLTDYCKKNQMVYVAKPCEFEKLKRIKKLAGKL